MSSVVTAFDIWLRYILWLSITDAYILNTVMQLSSLLLNSLIPFIFLEDNTNITVHLTLR